MEIILKETIDTLGQEGEVVKVKPGYARNYLIPKQKAVLVTSAALAQLERGRKAIELRLAQQKQDADKMTALLSDKVVVINKKVGDENRLFGSVTNSDIAAALEELGVKVDKRTIVMKEAIKALGEYTVPIKVGYQSAAEVKVQVMPEIVGE